MHAALVALWHWGFALIGGATAILFLAAPSMWKLPALLPLIAVQLGWTGYVITRARTAQLGKW
jgi:UDP-GlcNAc:undecaprenyl-phosphate GlcNAc-1-phosphate transferase